MAGGARESDAARTLSSRRLSPFAEAECRSVTLSFVDVDKLKVTERLPGWRGRYFHAVNMTVAHYEFTRGASIHEHHHPQDSHAAV
jgi:hypothetical protein